MTIARVLYFPFMTVRDQDIAIESNGSIEESTLDDQ